MKTYLPCDERGATVPAMPQVTIYLDKKTALRVAASARREKVPVSRWIRRRIEHGDSRVWPEGFFERTYGSVRDAGFKRPAQGKVSPVEPLRP